MKKQTQTITFILGLVLFIISIIIPYDSLEFILGAFRPVGLTSIFICPILGIIGTIFAIKNKDFLFLILNIIQILAFPMTIFVVYLIFGL